MSRYLALIACVGYSLLVGRTSQAHYLWVAVDKTKSGDSVANIYFEESPAPGDGHYLDHFLGTSDVWIRTLRDPQPKAVKAAEAARQDKRWLQVNLPETAEFSVDSYGKFGVYKYGKTNVLLHYYARHLRVASHDAIHELGRAEQLAIDLVPHDVGERLQLTLLWKGKPVADRMVYIRGPKQFRKNMTTDASGRITIEPLTTGRYTFRSSIELPTPGTDDGEPYELIRHNITLVLRLPLEG